MMAAKSPTNGSIVVRARARQAAEAQVSGELLQCVNRATVLLQDMTRNPELVEFLTLPAYWQLND